MINNKDLEYFYKFLNHKNETEVRVFGSNNRLFHYPTNLKQFLDECNLHNGQRLLYAGINERTHNGTSCNDIISFETVVVDIDAIREKGFEKQMATEEELKWVWENVVLKILDFYEQIGFKKPLIAYSGNGYQLYSKIPPIQITDENRSEINQKSQSFHKLLQKKFNPEGLEPIDAIGDLPRIIKCIGSMNVKGNGEGNRPHRLAKFLDVDYEKPIEDYKDSKLREFILKLEAVKKTYKSRGDYPQPTERESINYEDLPEPIKSLYSLTMKSSNGWMRVVSIFGAFFRSAGLDQDNCLDMIFDWQERQVIHEEGELEDIEKIVEDIYRKGISCPNFDTICNTSSGFPNMGIKDVLDFHEIKFPRINGIKNPIQQFLYDRNESSVNFKERFIHKRGKHADLGIVRLAKKHNLETCPFCKSHLVFYDKMGKFSCSKCSNLGGIEKLFRINNLDFYKFYK